MTTTDDAAAHARERARPRPRVEGDREQEILDAALDVLREVGYDKLTLDTVAARARASKATLYRRGDKATRRRRHGHLEGDAPAVPDTGTLRGDLLALQRRQVRHPRRRPDGPGLRPVHGDVPGRRLGAAIRDRFLDPRRPQRRRVLERARDRGEIARRRRSRADRGRSSRRHHVPAVLRRAPDEPLLRARRADRRPVVLPAVRRAGTDRPHRADPHHPRPRHRRPGAASRTPAPTEEHHVHSSASTGGHDRRRSPRRDPPSTPARPGPRRPTATVDRVRPRAARRRPAGRHGTAHLGLALAVISAAQLMVVLDATIVNIALPHLQARPRLLASRTCPGSSTPTRWPSAACCCSAAAPVTCSGGAGSFMVGVGLFALASLLGGLAQTETRLIGARILQGLGAAIASPTALSLITTTFPAGPGPQPRVRRLRGDVRRRRRDRPDPRRRAHRDRLALDVLHQRADRHRSSTSSPRSSWRVGAPARPLRPARRAHRRPPAWSASSTA